MTKYTINQKIEVIVRYQEGLESMTEIARSIGTDESVVRNWVKQFKYHGLAAFEKTYTSYTPQFKMDVLNFMREKDVSPNEAAAFFRISSPGLIRKWRAQLETKGYEAFSPKKKGPKSMKKESKKQPEDILAEGSTQSLEARIKQLEMENEYLKKLNALVQAKEKSPKKTK